MSSVIYLDHAATCRMRPEAIAAMTEAMEHIFGNASPSYSLARDAKRCLDDARAVLAETIGAGWNEIFFTSGGTESDNWALTGTAEALQHKGKHIVVSAIEHHAVLHTCAYLESRGFSVTRLPVDSEGRVRPEDLAAELNARPDTILVSVMAANNEIGTREDIGTLCRYTHDHGAVFHTDAVQAYGKTDSLNVPDIPVDLLSASAHKIGGPKGIGFLYVRNGTQLQSLLHGGSQERGRRAGTENVPAAAGFAAAAKAAFANMENDLRAERKLQAYFRERLFAAFGEQNGDSPAPSGILWNGPAPGGERLAGNISVSFPGVSAESLLISLDLAGICASGGSACTTGALDPSHVIMAVSGDRKRAEGTIRFTTGPENTKEEIDRTIEVLEEALRRIRNV